MDQSTRSFPEFRLARLLTTVFEPEAGERICILIDLPDPTRVDRFEFYPLHLDIFGDGAADGLCPADRFSGGHPHGLNPIILSTGLAVDHNEVSREAEKLRLALTRADGFEIDFPVADQRCTLKLLCDRQEAQKSHGLCRGKTPEILVLQARMLREGEMRVVIEHYQPAAYLEQALAS